MNPRVRPLLVGYIRADVLRDRADLPDVEAQLEGFAHREGFSLAAVYVERGSAPGAFDALMDAVSRHDAPPGVVVPDLRHVTAAERRVLAGRKEGAGTAVLTANLTPRAGGPGACAPDARQVRRSTSCSHV